MTWNLADAKNRRSEVVNLALSEGPPPKHEAFRGVGSPDYRPLARNVIVESLDT
ncbi:hypothetical protein SAMN05444166_5847 [Singulisphaera sp. GP187]|nr:hypothetical protein SAMN05444166_5847 [Singulisphaera sp. GP187]